MECKPASTIVVITIFILIFLMVGCGFFEKYKTEYQNNIVGNIKIQKQEKSNMNNLVFAETSEIYSVITEDCKIIYYDSLNKQIFVDSYLNETNRNYYQINILDALAKSVSTGIKKEKLNKNDFTEKTKNISIKWDFEKQ